VGEELDGGVQMISAMVGDAYREVEVMGSATYGERGFGGAAHAMGCAQERGWFRAVVGVNEAAIQRDVGNGGRGDIGRSMMWGWLRWLEARGGSCHMDDGCAGLGNGWVVGKEVPTGCGLVDRAVQDGTEV